ncbi:hypothetical protein [Natronomonas gomsonensis]|uniref:hypothetical protein n=1 Tax=Natronomonas gomsonensis TaxID=1046043 RepID=UPI0015B9A4B3|nr:hypothetical protein [Natronomonas gomsonensis]
MKRRSLLAAAAAATTTGIAGCLGGGPGTAPENDDESDDPTETPTGPRLVDQSFEVERVECGDDYGSHEVTKEDGVVTVEGVLDGRDSSYTAELVTSEYDRDADELYVEVESVEGDDEGASAQCIVEIEYVATFTFENGEPSSVRVDQSGNRSGSSSASQSVSASPETETPELTGTPTRTPSDDA